MKILYLLPVTVYLSLITADVFKKQYRLCFCSTTHTCPVVCSWYMCIWGGYSVLGVLVEECFSFVTPPTLL